MIKILLILLLCFGVFIVWKNQTPPKTLGATNGKLSPCPSTPNCYQTTIPHFPDAFNKIEASLKEHYLAKTVTKQERYMHIVVTTNILRFKDDLEFLIDGDSIAIRSASRVGYSDFGVNKQRIDLTVNTLSK